MNSFFISSAIFLSNPNVDISKLYTQPEEVAYAYENLLKVSPNFTIAASFGNVHGVYKPGNVVLSPEILKNSQDLIQKKFGTKEKPVNFVLRLIFNQLLNVVVTGMIILKLIIKS